MLNQKAIKPILLSLIIIALFSFVYAEEGALIKVEPSNSTNTNCVVSECFSSDFMLLGCIDLEVDGLISSDLLDDCRNVWGYTCSGDSVSLVGDQNADKKVDRTDIDILTSVWEEKDRIVFNADKKLSCADVNGNGELDDFDLLRLIGIVADNSKCTDSDNSPDYSTVKLDYGYNEGLNPEKNPDLFVAGVATGPYIYSSEGNYIGKDGIMTKIDDTKSTLYDSCGGEKAPNQITEAYCTKEGKVAYIGITNCPNGCQDGACIYEEVKEQVKCIFKNSITTQKCYSDKGSCEGTGACVVDVSGFKGENVTWKSTCGGYAYTYVDGQSDYAEFECSSNQKCIDSDGGKDYYEKGITNGNHEDTCLKDINWSLEVNYDVNVLQEMYCEKGRALTIGYSCSNGCNDGACLVKCSGIDMVWHTEKNEVRRGSYDYNNDLCEGYRCLTGNEISPSCYNLQECQNVCDGECININSAKKICGGDQVCDYYKLSITNVVNNNGKISIEYQTEKSTTTINAELIVRIIPKPSDGSGGSGGGAGSKQCPIRSTSCGSGSGSSIITCKANTECIYPTFQSGIQYYVKISDKSCTNVYDKKEIKPTTSLCIDTDNGRNIYVRGITSGKDWGSDNIVKYEDFCITDGKKAGRLAEYYCYYIDGEYKVRSESLGQEDGCFSCKDGACIKEIPTPSCDKYEILHVNFGRPFYNRMSQEDMVSKVAEILKYANKMTLKEVYGKFKLGKYFTYNTINADPFNPKMWGNSISQSVLNQYREDLKVEGKVLMPFTNFNYNVIKMNICSSGGSGGSSGGFPIPGSDDVEEAVNCEDFNRNECNEHSNICKVNIKRVKFWLFSFNVFDSCSSI